MTRNGKIARLPQHVRNELNQRLADGLPGDELVDWLNGHKEVQEVLHREFEDRPINEPNLSAWKLGGFVDWQRHQEACERVEQLVEQTEDLEELAQGESVANRLGVVLASELAVLAGDLLAEASEPKE